MQNSIVEKMVISMFIVLKVDDKLWRFKVFDKSNGYCLSGSTGRYLETYGGEMEK